MHIKQLRWLSLSFAVLGTMYILGGCTATPTVIERITNAQSIAKQAEFQSSIIITPEFDLVAFRKATHQLSDRLIIYIEGDGHAWMTASLPSNNPTPINPLALSLAVQDVRTAVAYLARPCQYVDLPSRGCSIKVWTNARFSPIVISSMSIAIDTLKKEFGAKELVLIGFSGGGAIAVLIASQRKDVAGIVTVAGNLDTEVWVSLNGLEPLTGSLNPASVDTQLKSMPQVHFIGGKDEVISKNVTESFLQKMGSPNQAKIIEIPNYGHVCCWNDSWKELLKKANQANSN
jgi:predicted alpha/beta hydrolase family esterase